MGNKIKLKQQADGKHIRFTATIPISSLEDDRSRIDELRTEIIGSSPDEKKTKKFRDEVVNWFQEHYICNLVFDDAKQHYVKSLGTTFEDDKNIIAAWDWDTNGIFPGHYKVHVNLEPIITHKKAGSMFYLTKESVDQKMKDFVSTEYVAKLLDEKVKDVNIQMENYIDKKIKDLASTKFVTKLVDEKLIDINKQLEKSLDTKIANTEYITKLLNKLIKESEESNLARMVDSQTLRQEEGE